MPNIVLIENQFREFSKFRARLDRGTINVFPAVDHYKDFIDHIRVALNKRYDARCKPALQKVIEMIEKFGPDLLIIDHILVGNHTGETGLNLAKDLREKFDAPIIFLSRTLRNDIDVCINLPTILPQVSVRWVPKGYPGTDFTEDPFFSTEIMPVVTDMIKLKQQLDSDKAGSSDARILVSEWIKEYINGRKSYTSEVVKDSVKLCKELMDMLEKEIFVPDEEFLAKLKEKENDNNLFNEFVDGKLKSLKGAKN